MTHKTVMGMEHKAGDALRHHAPVVQEKGGEALKSTALLLGEGLLIVVVASATVLASLLGEFEGGADVCSC